MKKVLLFLLIVTGVHALELNRVVSYQKALEKAAEEDKRVMVLMVQDNCRYCKGMKKTTFRDPEVIERINEDYIFVEVHRYNDSYPKKKLSVFGVPTTFFLYNDGELIMRGAGGYWNKEDFFSFMDDADYKVKKKLKNNK
jgi:thioredoxin-related protein